VRAGRFREDLYYRINVITIDLPDLCERVADIPLLVHHFVDVYAREMNREITGMDDRAMQILQRYRWRGNVRELQNVIERAVVLCKGHTLGVDDLPPKLLDTPQDESVEAYASTTLKDALEQRERRIIESALRANGWNRQLTAERLGINRTTLYKKMKRLGLEIEPLRAHSY
jgi:DNA-binding NtrC family response regulator